MLKKITLGTAFLLVALFTLASLAGLTPSYILHGPGVATGMGSKLLCSARYLTGFSEQQAFDDLVQYSPLLQQLNIEYDDSAKQVTTTLFGLSEKTATFLPDLGCAVEYQGYEQRRRLQTRGPAPSPESWPLGGDVGEANPAMGNLLQSLLAEDNRRGLNSRALLVAHGGRIIGEAYGQGADAETPLLGWSMAKSLIAVVLGNLEYRRLLDPEQALPFPGWAQDERRHIRVEHLLRMTDGLEFSERYNPGDDATAMLFTAPSVSDYALGQSALHEPGRHFNYSSGSANLLARLHREILGSTQRSYDDFMTHIHAPMGLEHALWETDASGVFVASSYFYASARDWARLGQLMLNGGILNGHRIVSRDWVRRATTPNTTANRRAYGYQWWLNRGDEAPRFDALPEDAFFASGNRQQLLMVIPSRDVVIVRLGWTAGAYPVNDNFSQILDLL